MLVVKKILIIAPSWVGDMMMAQALMMSLKEQNPEVVIDVLAPNWTQALTARMPEVNKAIMSPFKHGKFALIDRIKLGRELKKNQYDEAYVLPNSFKSALVPLFANIPNRIGWCGEARFGLLNDLRFLDKKAYPLMIQRFSALSYPARSELGKKIRHPKLTVLPAQVEATLERFGIDKEALTQQKIMAICPGAEFGASKRWPESHFSELINQLAKNNWKIWIFGSEKDKLISETILRHTDYPCLDFTGKTSLDQAIDLLSVVNSVVTNDSGLMHIACALQKPVVAIYGSTSTGFTPPLGKKLEVVQLDLPCRPCFKRECPLGHHQCMKDIKPDNVMKSVDKLCVF
jgi:heptosyltransferase-2